MELLRDKSQVLQAEGGVRPPGCGAGMELPHALEMCEQEQPLALTRTAQPPASSPCTHACVLERIPCALLLSWGQWPHTTLNFPKDPSRGRLDPDVTA